MSNWFTLSGQSALAPLALGKPWWLLSMVSPTITTITRGAQTMPTVEEVLQYIFSVSRFLAALYDAEPRQHRRLGLSQVTKLLEVIGASNRLVL